MSKTSTPRPIGPRQQAALAHIAKHPGCSTLAAVEAAGAGKWRRSRGYQIVERMERRGLISRRQLASGRYECRVTEAGAALL